MKTLGNNFNENNLFSENFNWKNLNLNNDKQNFIHTSNITNKFNTKFKKNKKENEKDSNRIVPEIIHPLTQKKYPFTGELKRLVDISPYTNIPKSAKYSWVNKPGMEDYYTPKLQRALKDNQGNSFKHVSQGSSTLFFKEKDHKKDLLKKLLNSKEEFSSSFLKALRIKNIRKLINNNTSKLKNLNLGIIDIILEKRRPIKYLIDKNKSYFTIKTLDELMSILNLKGEKEFSCDVFSIFGENTKNEISDEIIKNFGKDIGRKRVNFREVIATLAFFRMNNYQAKISSKIFNFYFN